jgi:hypothetical protein
MRVHALLLLSAWVVCFSGCATYDYRVVQPAGVPQPVADQSVIIRYDPLEYQLVRFRGRLAMSIVNPTEDRITLLSERSFVVDPQGGSHPLRGGILAPHSHIQMLLPPIPFTFVYPDWGWGWGPGWGWEPGWGAPYYPYWGPYWGPAFYGPPPVVYSQAKILTPYDWTWNAGSARFRLTYDSNNKIFEHDFEIIRERRK